MKTFATSLLTAMAAAQTYNGGTDAYPTAVTMFVMDLSNTFICSPAWDSTSAMPSTAFNTMFDTLKTAGANGVMLPFFPATSTLAQDNKTTYTVCNTQVRSII